MRRVTHLALGAATGLLVSSLTDQPTYDLAVIGGFFGVAPDLDLLFAGLGKRVHRSPATHSLLASIGFMCVWGLAVLSEGHLTGTGYLSATPVLVSSLVVFSSVFVHALSDSATVYGCRLMFPLTSRVFRGPVRYDDAAANTLLLLLALVVIAVALSIGQS